MQLKGGVSLISWVGGGRRSRCNTAIFVCELFTCNRTADYGQQSQTERNPLGIITKTGSAFIGARIPESEENEDSNHF